MADDADPSDVRAASGEHAADDDASPSATDSSPAATDVSPSATVIEPSGAPRPIPEWVRRTGLVSWALLGAIGLAAVIVFTLGALRGIVIPLVLAGFVAIVFSPAVDRLEQRRVPRALGALLVIVGIAVVFAAAVTIVIVGVFDRADDLTAALDDAQAELGRIFSQWDLDRLLDELRGGDAGDSALAGLGTQVGTVLGSAAAFASGLVLGIVLLYYLLKDGHQVPRSLADRRTPSASAQTERVLLGAAASIRGYFRGRTILAVVQGVTVAAALWLFDVPLAGSIGVVNFVGAFVPYLGAVLGGAFAVLMGLAGDGVGLALYALVVVLVVNLVLENLLEPRVMGSSLDLHPAFVLLATVGGGLFVGIVGLILGAPALAIGRSLYRELRDTGFFGSDSAGARIATATEPPGPDDTAPG